ncbi:hypothetical protein PALB_27460 [Pseudoalteromonas luteoviolacea B = ATCC 29581]|nr:hypothetical protein PALB_27460 [Pseudoalteromonas luteoviolacea B = ATCC 29581]
MIMTEKQASPVDSQINLEFDLDAIARLTPNPKGVYIVPGNPTGFITITPDDNSIVESFDETVLIQPRVGTFYRSMSFKFSSTNRSENRIVSIANTPTQSNSYNNDGTPCSPKYSKNINSDIITYNLKSGVSTALLGDEELTFTINVIGPNFDGACQVIWDPIIPDEGKV